MLLGIFADIHDHLDHARAAVAEFNRRECELVVFSGDFVSTFVIPVLRELNCKLIGCFGDNEGNKPGLLGGLRIIGTVGEPPLGFRAADGTKILVTHQFELFRGDYDGADVVVYGHTHKPSVETDAAGRLFINPGETSGWTYRRPTIAVLDTTTRTAEIIPLAEMTPLPPRKINRSTKTR
ncbi:MAG: metallophosphoesterase [Planctomycetales bacterium]|nr:metallophosphoesterase [Planctomycetales bacterium]MBN8624977.1 metallophosphoesterase [Planctomycetota bacterium]